MTVSMFEAFMLRMEAVRAQRKMDLAESAIYASTDSNGRQRIWNSWLRHITTINTKLRQQKLIGRNRHNLFMWDGEVISRNQIKKKFRVVLGRQAKVE